jgi:hypothetical protein
MGSEEKGGERVKVDTRVPLTSAPLPWSKLLSLLPCTWKR